MFKQTLVLTILFTVIASFYCQPGVAVSLIPQNGSGSGMDAFPARLLQAKGSQPYDESKDPALRRGSENGEQSQASYFIIPGAVIGIIGLFLFFNREKSD